jgi:hypothetical protein
MALLEMMASVRMAIVVMADHDSPLWGDLDFCLVAGIIVENACILRNGDRRDYFRSGILRDAMRKSATERDNRTEFFVGFLDLWEQRPSAAVVRRAAKVSQHFGAVMEHGPVDRSRPTGEMRNASRSISAFEFLRLSENIEVRSAWKSNGQSNLL